MTPFCYNRPAFTLPLAIPAEGHRWRCPICGFVGVLEQVGKSATFRAPLHYAPGNEPRELEVN